MTGHTAHVPRRGIVNDPAPWLAIYDLSGSDAFQPGLRRKVAGVLHAQRTVNISLYEFLQRHFRDALNDFTRQKEINIAVAQHGSWLRLQLLFGCFLNGSLLAVPIGFGFDVWAK